MLDYAFIELLETLTRDELKKFRKFIISPYFNRSRKTVKVFDILLQHHPNLDKPALTKEFLHNKINPGKPYNELTMRSVMHDLQRMLSKFISQQNYERKEAESKIFTLEELAIKGSERMHSITVKEAEKVLNRSPYTDSSVCHNRFRLETEKFYFNMIKERISKKSFVNSEASKLIKGITYFIGYFMLEAVKHNDVLLNYSRTYNVKHNIKFISQFLNLFDFERLEIFMEENSIAGLNVIRAYLSTLRAYLYMDNDEYYFKMKDAVMNYIDELSADDKHMLFAKLTGYCILKRAYIKDDDIRFEHELLELYTILLNNKLYRTGSNKFIPADLYRNIIIQAAKLHELNRMEEFISEYSELLHPVKKEDIINYSYAMLEFERGNFNSSISRLSRIKTEEFSYHLDIRLLYIQIYYELNEFDSAISAVKAFRKYLDENQIAADEKRSAYVNFCQIVTRIINLSNTKSKTDPQMIAVQIRKSKTLASKGWLLNKIAIKEGKHGRKYSTAG